jgi:hypothetical protein
VGVEVWGGGGAAQAVDEVVEALATEAQEGQVGLDVGWGAVGQAGQAAGDVGQETSAAQEGVGGHDRQAAARAGGGAEEDSARRTERRA